MSWRRPAFYHRNSCLDLTLSVEEVVKQIEEAKANLLIEKVSLGDEIFDYNSEDGYDWNGSLSFDCNLSFTKPSGYKKYWSNLNCFARLTDYSYIKSYKNFTNVSCFFKNPFLCLLNNIDLEPLAFWWKTIHFFWGDNFKVNNKLQSQITFPVSFPISSIFTWFTLARAPYEDAGYNYTLGEFYSSAKDCSSKPIDVSKLNLGLNLSNPEWLPYLITIKLHMHHNKGIISSGHSPFIDLVKQIETFSDIIDYLLLLDGQIGEPLENNPTQYRAKWSIYKYEDGFEYDKTLNLVKHTLINKKEIEEIRLRAENKKVGNIKSSLDRFDLFLKGDLDEESNRRVAEKSVCKPRKLFRLS